MDIHSKKHSKCHFSKQFSNSILTSFCPSNFQNSKLISKTKIKYAFSKEDLSFTYENIWMILQNYSNNQYFVV